LSVREPLRDAEINIKGTIRLLEAAKEYKVGKVVFASSGGAIYGEATEVPTAETYMPEPVSPYAISKLSAEKYLRYYHHQYGLACIILRYSNVYGPRQIRQGEAGVVAIFAEGLLQGHHPVLYHFDGDTSGMVRDYCYVKDIARANLLAMESDKVGIFNIGTGKGTTTLVLYEKIVSIVRASGKKLPSVYDKPLLGGLRPGDIPVSTLNIEKAERELGWQPLYDMDRALSETIHWYSENET
jgi:UDP-glucose 4-epimerase